MNRLLSYFNGYFNGSIQALGSGLIFRKKYLNLLLLGSAIAGFVYYDYSKWSQTLAQQRLDLAMDQITDIWMADPDLSQYPLGIQAWVLTTLELLPGAERGQLIAFLAQLNVFPALPLPQAQLQQGQLRQLSLSGIQMEGANLTDSDLHLTLMAGAALSSAILTKADLSAADLSGSDLRSINAQRSDWSGVLALEVDFSGADLSLATLYSGSFMGSSFRQAYLESANLRRSSFRGADLTEASLIGADLRQTDLREASLIGADLRQTNFEGTFWTGARYDSNTRFPDGFNLDDYDLINVEQVE